MEGVAKLKEALRAEAGEQGVKGGSHAQVRNLAEEVSTVVLLLDRECLKEEHVSSASLWPLCLSRLTSGSDAPAMVTSLMSSSCVCCFPGGQAFHIPDTDTAVPVERLCRRRKQISQMEH